MKKSLLVTSLSKALAGQNLAKVWAGYGILAGAMVAGLCVAGGATAAESQPPEWAYATPPAAPAGAPPAAAAAVDDGKVYSLPGTDRTFTANQIRGRLDNVSPARVPPADWYPGDHPAMPKIVAEGDPTRGIVACDLCHYPNGKGRSENASPAGLPKDYIIEQMHDMRDGLRQSADSRKANTKQMIAFAKAMTEDEIGQAATYFSSMTWTPWIHVVESKTTPKVHSNGGLYLPLEGADAGTEPLGDRIVEVPVNPQHTSVLRDPRSPFIAYVPIGSVEKGRDIVKTGAGGKATPCAICHGETLNGLGAVPGIAARSPSYIARQLYDIQQGARNGGMTALMKPVVAKLTNEDILDIAAYTASLPAPSTSVASASASP